MQRYFIQFNYFGTRFRGLQKQLFREKTAKLSEPEVKLEYEKEERTTVQGALESAVWNVVKPPNPVKFATSSRTDKGVHALINTAHVDLCPSSWHHGRYVPPREITKMVNLWMIKKDLDVRVSKTVAVPPTFHSRYNVLSRTYLYKIAVLPEVIKSETPFKKRRRRSKEKEDKDGIFSKLSILESGRYFELKPGHGRTFDFELFKQALSLMEGEHNFSNFCKIQGHFKYYTIEGERYIKIPRTADEMTKNVTKIEVICQAPPLLVSLYPSYGGFQFIDVVIEGKSFLHNQVRRMVGAAVSVACGRIPLERVSEMLGNPDMGWNGGVYISPPNGLYLAKIEYKEGALDQATESYEEMLKMEKIEIFPTEDNSDETDSDSDKEIQLPKL